MGNAKVGLVHHLRPPSSKARTAFQIAPPSTSGGAIAFQLITHSDRVPDLRLHFARLYSSKARRIPTLM